MREFDTLQICPLHLSDVATLPWEMQKVIFQHTSLSLRYLNILRYLRRKQIATVVLQLSCKFTSKETVSHVISEIWRDESEQKLVAMATSLEQNRAKIGRVYFKHRQNIQRDFDLLKAGWFKKWLQGNVP